ncbi:MAG: hypothetical protein Q8914_06000, partial [Bacteroidota bacterium]|nr:hypothetical protein [Bacteroidota bacterium]
MKRILLFFGLLALGLTVYAQVRPSHAAFPDGRRQAAPAFKMDSLRNGEHAHQGPPPPPKPRRFFHESDTLTLSDYIISIARINDQLNTIRDSAQLGYEIDHLQDDISEMTQEIKLFRQNTRGRHTAISIKNLYLYQSFVSNLKDENDQVRSRVNALYNRSYKAKLQLRRTLDDSIFRAIYVNRTAVINLDSKLGRVERKWKRTDSIVKGSLDTLDVLKATVADNSMKLSDMLNIIGKRLNRAKPQLFGPEISCLWHFQPTQPLARDSSKSMNLWKSEQKAIGFYFRQTSGKRSIVVFVGLLLYLWLFFKRKLLKKIKSTPETWHFLNLRYLNTSPVVSLLVAILSLMPFFDAYAPTSYMAMVFIVLLVAVTILFRRQSEPRFFSYWYGLVGLLIVDTVTYLVIEPATLPRLWMLAVHAAIIVTAIRFYKKISVQEPYSKWVRPAIVTGIVLTGLAVIANLFGRFSLAGILGLSGIFAITQALTLPIFIDTILEIVLVQLVSGRLKKGVDKPFDSSAV